MMRDHYRIQLTMHRCCVDNIVSKNIEISRLRFRSKVIHNDVEFNHEHWLPLVASHLDLCRGHSGLSPTSVAVSSVVPITATMWVAAATFTMVISTASRWWCWWLFWSTSSLSRTCLWCWGCRSWAWCSARSWWRLGCWLHLRLRFRSGCRLLNQIGRNRCIGDRPHMDMVLHLVVIGMSFGFVEARHRDLDAFLHPWLIR